jgi:hydrogenase nickel incorporation protein HypB
MKIKIVKDILEANEYVAQKVSEDMTKRRIMMVNIIGSPGAGKTSFILKTIENIEIQSGVIEGDIASDIDSKKIATYGIPVVQINTGGACHLNANMIDAAIKEITLENAILFVENVGNLVCPASFDIGEDFKIALSSVTEGDDKPYKYPAVFGKAKATVLNKIDLINCVQFKRDYFYDGLKTLNPQGLTFEVSSVLGIGIREWGEWLETQFREKFKK